MLLLVGDMLNSYPIGDLRRGYWRYVVCQEF